MGLGGSDEGVLGAEWYGAVKEKEENVSINGMA